MRTHLVRPTLALVLGCLLAILLFLLGTAGAAAHFWGRYLLPILVVFLWGRRRDIYIVTALVTMLVAAEYWTDRAPPGDFLIYHLLYILLLWGAAWVLARRHAELQASEQRFAKVFHANPGGIVITRQSDGLILEINAAGLALSGYTREQLVGRTGVELGILPAQRRAKMRAAFHAQGYLRDLDIQLINARGEPADILYSAEEIELNGEPAYLGLIVDVTERKRLAAQADHLAALVDAAGDAITSCDLDGKILTMNPSAEALYGIAADATIGQNIATIVPPELLGSLHDAMPRNSSGEIITDDSVAWRRPDGSTRILSLSLAPVRNRAGQVSALSAIARDVTERKAAGRDRLFLSALVASSPEAVIGRTADGTILSWNHGAERLFGYTAAEAIGQNITMLAAPDGLAHLQDVMVQVALGHDVEGVETQRMAKDGRVFDCEVSSFPVRDGSGAIVGVASFTHDISERKAAEQALAASEHKYRDLYDNSPDMYFVGVPAQGLILDCNQTLARTLGYTPAELIGGPSSVLYVPATYAQLQADRDELMATGKYQSDAVQLCRRDGTRLDVIMAVTLEHDPAGGPARARVTLHDITERKAAEQALRASEERFARLFSSSPVAITFTRLTDGLYQEVNDTFLAMIGWSRAEVIGRTSLELGIISPEDRQRLAAELQVQGSLRGTDLVIHTKRGELLNTLFSIGLVDFEGESYLLSSVVDITRRRQAEDALAESERKYRDLYDNSPDMYMSGYTTNHLIRECNETLARTLGYTREELLGQPNSIVLTPASYSHMLAELPKYAGAGEYANIEVQLQCKDGTVMDALASGLIEPPTADRPAYSRVTLHDITERKRAEQALRESQARYQMLADHVTDVIWSMDPACKVTYVSPSALRQSGFTPEETIGLTLEQTFAPGSRAAARTTIGEIYRLIQAGQPVPATPNVFEMLRKDGTTYWGENIYSVVYNAQGEFQQLVGATREVTRRVHSEAELREAYQRVRLAADAAAIGIWNWNFADDILEWDDRMCELYGVPLSAREQGLYYDIWRSHLHPDDRDAAESTFLATINDGSPVGIHYRIVLPDGTLRYIQAASIIDYSDSGAPQRMIGINRDVTDQMNYQRLLQDTNAVLEEHVAARTAELRTALAELQRASQLKDEFMALISHELRTPLTGVLSMSEMLEEQVSGPLNARQAAYVKNIIHSGERLLTVINGILTYTHLLSGKVKLDVEPCDLAHLLNICAVSQQHKAAAKNQAIAVAVTPPGLAITADATALAEVLKRLLDNAVKFTPDGGRIGLEAHFGTEPHTVDLVVWDTGIGIAPDLLDDVFHALIQADARLSRSHEGIGLGLAYVHEMVRLMGGSVVVASTPGEGSQFTVTLPEAR